MVHYIPADCHELSYRQRQALHQWQPQLQQAWHAGWMQVGVQGGHLEAAQLWGQPPWNEEPLLGVSAHWQQELPWHIYLSAEAVQALLGAQLGQEELSAHEITELDLRLLQISMQKFAAHWSQGLSLRRPPSEIVLKRGGFFSFPQRLLGWTGALCYGKHHGCVWLATELEALGTWLQPPSGAQQLPLEAIASLPVEVEVMLQGPVLSVQELLSLQPQDILLLGQADKNSFLCAHQRLIGWGHLGAKGHHLALHIRQMGAKDTLSSIVSRRVAKR